MHRTGTYGEISTAGAAYGSPYGYNGEYSHALTGLQYLRARYYDAATGSFISKDSYAGNIRNILSMNRYTYGENNPLGYADPGGHSVLSKIRSAVKSAVTSVKNKVARVKTAVTGAWNRIKSAAQTVSDAGRTVHTERIVGETESQWKNRVAQEKAKKSSAKADLASIPLNLYEGTKGFLNRKLEECADQIDSSIFGSAVYTAADLVCQAEQKACKGFSYCYNSVQQKIPDKDLSRILKGVGLIAVGAGKVTGAVALAAISAPFCGVVVGVAGEAAAGITAAAGGGDIAQGLQEIMCGWNGDSESESYNLVRDTLYSGNETAYQISTVTAAVCGGAGKWLGTRAAKAAEAAAKKAAEEAAGLADETAEAAAKTAAKEAGEAAEEAVKQSTKDALEDAAGETAIENLDGIEGIGKSGTSTKGVGNPVKVEGRGNTGRTSPNTLNEQMAMHQVQSNPLEGATKVPLEMTDPRWPASEGWVKMQSVVQNSDGTKTTIHYVYNEITGAFDDFKLK